MMRTGSVSLDKSTVLPVLRKWQSKGFVCNLGSMSVNSPKLPIALHWQRKDLKATGRGTKKWSRVSPQAAQDEPMSESQLSRHRRLVMGPMLTRGHSAIPHTQLNLLKSTARLWHAHARTKSGTSSHFGFTHSNIGRIPRLKPQSRDV